MSDVSSLGVYRSRVRDEDVWSFSDRLGTPDSKFIGVRAGVCQRPQRDSVCLEAKRRAAQRMPVDMIMRRMRSEDGSVLNGSFPSSLNSEGVQFFFLQFEWAIMCTLSPPESDSWLTSRLFIDALGEAIPEVEPYGTVISHRRTSRKQMEVRFVVIKARVRTRAPPDTNESEIVKSLCRLTKRRGIVSEMATQHLFLGSKVICSEG